MGNESKKRPQTVSSKSWAEVDSNHRSKLQQIYSLSPLATRESAHSISSCIALTSQYYSIASLYWQDLFSTNKNDVHGPWLVATRKKKTATNAAFLGEGIFTMGYSKNYIMYWGVFTVIIIAWLPREVCTNFTKVYMRFCAISQRKIRPMHISMHERIIFCFF